MKKVVSALTAAAMCASMAAGVMSVFAAYTPEEIAFSLEVISEGNYTVDGNTITFASAEDAKNATFTLAHFIEADADPAKADFQMVGAHILASDPAINLGAAVDINSSTYSDTAVSYTKADGTAFSTKYYVNCFGYLNALSKYKSGCMAWTSITSDEFKFEYTGNDRVTWMWQYSFDASVYENYIETAHFFGSTSDEYPLTQLEVTLGEDITDGTYEISFVEEFDGGEGLQLATFVTPSAWAGDGSKSGTPYIPTLKNLTIQVGEATSEEETTTASEEETTTASETEAPTTTASETDPPTSDTSGDTGNTEIGTDFTWYIEKVTADPGAMVPVHVFVANDPGTAGYETELAINGGTVADSGLSIIDIMAGNADETSTTYAEFSMFAPNPEYGAVASSRTDNANSIAVEGEAVYVMYFQVPADAEPGAVYELSFSKLNVSNEAYEELTPKTIAGSITINGGETTTEPQETTTEPEETTTTESETAAPETTAPTQGGDETYLYGDVNKNDVVELVDIVMLNRALTGYNGESKDTLDAYQTEVADCYDDAVLDGKDSMEILKYLIGLNASLPTAAN